jgi:hypothetical protein
MLHLDWVLYFDSPPRICDALPPLFSKERGERPLADVGVSTLKYDNK